MKIRTKQSTFAGAVEGTAVDLQAGTDDDMVLAGLWLSAGYTGTAITFKTSLDNGTTWAPVIKTDGTAYEVTCTGSTVEFISMPPTDLSACPMLKPVAAATITTGTIDFVLRKP